MVVEGGPGMRFLGVENSVGYGENKLKQLTKK